jgi:hypothetical protein
LPKVLGSNLGMFKVFEKSGLRLTKTREGLVIHVTLKFEWAKTRSRDHLKAWPPHPTSPPPALPGRDFGAPCVERAIAGVQRRSGIADHSGLSDRGP